MTLLSANRRDTVSETLDTKKPDRSRKKPSSFKDINGEGKVHMTTVQISTPDPMR